MPEQITVVANKINDFWTALAYTVVAVSGASGGCLVVAHHVLRGRSVTGMHVLAYSFIGAVMSLAGLAAMILVGLIAGINMPFEKLLIIGLVLGVAGCLALASANLSLRFVLRRLGIEVDVQIKKIDRE